MIGWKLASLSLYLLLDEKKIASRYRGAIIALQRKQIDRPCFVRRSNAWQEKEKARTNASMKRSIRFILSDAITRYCVFAAICDNRKGIFEKQTGYVFRFRHV